MKVLFTAVGKSDPMTIFENLDVHDGGILHICRVHRPEKAYLYMSQEICAFDEMDNRYERAIHLLDEKIEVHKILRPELVDVHRFDAFYDEFENIIQDIINECGTDTEIICNVSSGTPAMKGAFQVLSALSKYRTIPVQVDDPSKGIYKRDVDLKNYDVDAYWRENLDNLEVNNRTYRSHNEDLTIRIQKEMIISALNSYDYEGAYRIAEDYASKFTPEIVMLLKFAKARSIFDIKEMLQLQRQLNVRLLPYEASDKIKLFEYALILNNKFKRDEMVDFLRGLNPFLYSVLSKFFYRNYGFELESYCDSKTNKLSRRNLESDEKGREILQYLERNGVEFQDKFINEGTLLDLTKKHMKSRAFRDSLENLDNLRESKRNVASHEMVCIKGEDILKDLKVSPKKYIADIQAVLQHLGYDVKQHWDSYDRMNAYIIDQLK